MKGQTWSVVLEDVRKMALREFPLPRIGEEDGLLRVEMCGICGSDVGIYNGKNLRVQQFFPIIPGHEILGRIEEMGEKASQRHGVRKGDRVVVEFTFGCGYCRFCLEGRYVFCQEGGRYGGSISCNTPPIYGALTGNICTLLPMR